MSNAQRASLDLTHVLYDDSSLVSLFLALITLSPILLMAAYAALAVQTRELTIITMWAGQLFCEGFNWILKRAIKQDRPIALVTVMAFLPRIANIWGSLLLSSCATSVFVTGSLRVGIRYWIRHGGCCFMWALARAVGVTYYRYYLTYHTPHQILWGFAIGVLLGLSLYVLTELIPRRYPTCLLGRARDGLLKGQVMTWLQIRDGWDIWSDGGREGEWMRWRGEWKRRRRGGDGKMK